jgi:hypothetical protein
MCPPQHVSGNADFLRSSFDDEPEALLSNQRQQLADVTTIAGSTPGVMPRSRRVDDEGQ